jgi:hypothetical protein
MSEAQAPYPVWEGREIHTDWPEPEGKTAVSSPRPRRDHNTAMNLED